MIELHLRKGTEFNRTPGGDDPPRDLCFEVANGVLQRIRAIEKDLPEILPVLQGALRQDSHKYVELFAC
jgi:hypothetical protein